ncbi:hypothetical protein ACFXA3_41860 [Streptomyces sp. NPDC059456]|uniref:hypothetical protein n=1 Tax=Streptomyces sp. NPDC059456 TaxID=3346838 RepID=UPI003686D68B
MTATETAGGTDTEWSAGPGRSMGAVLVLASLIPALICGFVFAAWLPSAIGRYDAYTAAAPCPAPEAGAGAEAGDCLLTVPFTVDATVVKEHGRGNRFKAVLSGGPAGNGTVSFGDPGPVLAGLTPGEQVTGVVWRGTVTAIVKDGLRQASADEPRDEAQITAGLGTFAGLLAALGLGFAAAYAAGFGGRQPWTWRSLGKPLVIGAAVTCAGVAVPAFVIGLPWWVVPAVAVPFVAFASGQLYRYRRSATGSGPAE